MPKSTRRFGKCKLKILEMAANELLEFEWNNQEKIMIIPTKASSTIINSILKVNTAINEYSGPEELRLILKEIIVEIREVVLDQIKVKLIISRHTGYDLLCDELDYLYENFREFFEEKNGIEISSLKFTIDEIKNIKKIYLS